MALPSGTRLGHYEILGPGDEVGLSEVYRAHDSRFGREVALRMLTVSGSSEPGILLRFEHEARTAGRLHHPNILLVHDVGAHEGRPYVVSERLEGETLRDRLRRGALTPEEALGFSLQIAHGLSAAHAEGIVHRDLRPENLLLEGAHVKILDF